MIPLSDTVFRDPDMPPACNPDNAWMFFSSDITIRRRAAGFCQVCPMGPYGPKGNLCANFLDDHPEIARVGVWGCTDHGGVHDDE